MFIFVYGTGRCGTGYLARLLGGPEGSKLFGSVEEGVSVGHEPWADLPINKLKMTEPKSDEYMRICGEYLNMKRKAFGSERVLVSDHRVGRYFLPYIMNSSDHEFKIIYMDRDQGAVVRSFFLRIKKREFKYSKERFSKFYSELWTHSLFTKSDIFLGGSGEPLLHDSQPIRMLQDLTWHVHRTKKEYFMAMHGSRWPLVKNRLLEISFSDLITDGGAEIISNFTGIPYVKQIVGEKVNE